MQTGDEHSVTAVDRRNKNPQASGCKVHIINISKNLKKTKISEGGGEETDQRTSKTPHHEMFKALV